MDISSLKAHFIYMHGLASWFSVEIKKKGRVRGKKKKDRCTACV